MKKIFFLFALLVFAYSAWTQTLTESFDGTTFPPTGWVNTQVSGTGLWARTTAGTTPTCAPHSGAGMAWYDSYDYAVGVNALLVTPALTFTGGSAHVLSFWMYGDSGWNIYPDSMGVYYNSSPNLTAAHWLATVPRYNAMDGWYKYSYMIPAAVTGTQYIIFRGYSQYGDNMFLDDVNLVLPPAHDLSTVSVDNQMYLTSTSPTVPTATIKNTGLNTETSVDVICKIYNYSGTEIYTNTQTLSSLASWATSTVNFASYTLPNAEAIYTIKVYTSLTGDLDHTNDTIVKTVYTYTHDKQNVLVETGTGTWCQYCPGAAMGVDDLISNGKQVAVVENHSGDTYANTSSEARVTYYNMTGFPTAVFDGIKQLVGGDHTNSLYSSYLPIYDARYAIKTAFGITINGAYSDTVYNLSIVVDRYGETPFANSNLVLHLALTQSHISFSWQGQTHLEYVSRLMSPSATGTSINLSTANQVTVPLTFNFHTGWGGSIANHDYELVAWVQDLTTMEVVDAAKLDLNSILPLGIHSITNNPAEINIYPNPAKNNFTFETSQVSAGSTLSVLNISGQELLKQNITANTTQIDVSKLSSGIYFVKFTNDKTVEVRKIIIE